MHVAAVGDPAPRQVVLEAADAVEVRVEAPAGDRLDEVEHVLAVAEPVERGRDRADLQTHLAEEQQERRDARQLGEDRADVLAHAAAPRSPISCSAAWMNGTSFANDDSQSMRLMSVVICGYVRYSVSFS